MQLIKNYINHLERLKAKIPDFARDAILENRGKIVNLVRYEQLAKGKNSYGKSLSNNKGYSMYTQAYADRDGIALPKTQGQEYNFQWSSQTFDNMYLDFVDTKKFTYEINTAPAKEKLLEDIYGEIFKLTDEHNDWINKNIIEPYVGKQISSYLFVF